MVEEHFFPGTLLMLVHAVLQHRRVEYCMLKVEGKSPPAKARQVTETSFFLVCPVSLLCIFFNLKNIFDLVLSIKHLWSCSLHAQALADLPLSSDPIRIL